MNKAAEFKKVFDLVMKRLEKQFLVPATYTLVQKPNNIIEIHVLLHGCSITHYCDMDYFFDVLGKTKNDALKVDEISDYLIEFFIHALREENEKEVLSEIEENLEYVYDQIVQTKYWYDKKTKLSKVSFIPFQSAVVITMDAKQLKDEYHNRFSSEDAPDVLVDLSQTIKLFYYEGFQRAKEYLDQLNRNIVIERYEDSALGRGEYE